MTYFQAIANELQEAIDRVRELHKPDENGRCVGCDSRCGCYTGDIKEYNTWETCPTIKALNNEVQ
jgi:hypothetical protein